MVRKLDPPFVEYRIIKDVAFTEATNASSTNRYEVCSDLKFVKSNVVDELAVLVSSKLIPGN